MKNIGIHCKNFKIFIHAIKRLSKVFPGCTVRDVFELIGTDPILNHEIKQLIGSAPIITQGIVIGNDSIE